MVGSCKRRVKLIEFTHSQETFLVLSDYSGLASNSYRSHIIDFLSSLLAEILMQLLHC